ncbi:nucleoside hydrolase [Paracidobacterium acidisoli]|uniref:nucleoside hydrolase n=1 Tax=Paracidobacterium acidisoli TaxID=2303751 RepID=UPI003314C7DA
MPEKIIFDTDIGDDIDDAFALALLLQSPEVKILGVTTAWGDTNLRARLVSRFLRETGHSDIPVFSGTETKSAAKFSQAQWAGQSPERRYPDAVSFMLDTIRRYPGEVTLVSVAPFTNVGALISRDASTFRKLKRVVIMGGSVYRGYGDTGYAPGHGPEAEYNIYSDISSSKKLFTADVPIYMMPLDSTQIPLDEVRRDELFSHGTAMTDALTLLYHQWSAANRTPTPTLFDAMAAAYAIRPELCPVKPMHIEVDDKGFTRPAPGTPNAEVCLNSDVQQFYDFYMPRVLKPGTLSIEQTRRDSSAHP